MSTFRPGLPANSGRGAEVFSGPLAATGRGGQPRWMLRTCLKCGSGPGMKCRRWVSERYTDSKGTHEGEGRWTYLKLPHDERRHDPINDRDKE